MAGKVQEKRAEKKMRQAAENGCQVIGGIEGGFVREGYSALGGTRRG